MRARLFVVAALLLLAPAPARAQTAEELVRALAKQALDGDVTVAKASWSGSVLDLTDVTVLDADRELVARLGRVHVELRPLALYGQGTVDAVDIEGVALRLRRLPDGSLGVGRILQKSGGGGRGFAITRARIHGPLVVAAPGRAPTTMTVDVAASLERAGASTRLLVQHAVVTLGRTVVGAEGALALDGGAARGKLSGRLGGLSWMPAAATWGWELQVDGNAVRGSVALPHGALSVDANLAGGGWRAEVGGHDVALEDLARDAGGRISGTLRVSTNGQSSKLALDATARALRVGEIGAATVELRGEGDLLAKSGSVQLHATEVVSGGLPVGDVRIVAGGDRQRVTVEATTASARGSAHLEAAGTPSWRGDQPIGIDATLGRLQLEGRGQRWALARPARLQIGRALVLGATTLERHGGDREEVSLSGRIETRSGRLDVRVVGHRLALRTIVSALGAELALPDLALEVTARARGALGSPRVELTADGVAAPDPRLGGAAAAVHLSARLADGRLVGQGEVRAGEAHIDTKFDVPAQRSRAPVRAHAHADALPLAWLSPLVPGLALAGAATVDIDVQGPRLEPRVIATVSAQLAGGGAVAARLRGALPAPGAPPSAQALDGELTLRALPLDRLLPSIGLPATLDGTLRLSGDGKLPALGGHLSAHAGTKVGALAIDADVSWAERFSATLAATLDRAPLVRGVAVAALPLSSVVRGGFDRSTIVAFDGTVPGFDLASIAPLGGMLTGTVTMKCPLDAPALRAQLRSPALTVAGVPLGPATVAAAADRSGARAELEVRPPAGGTLTAHGRWSATERSVRVVAAEVQLAVADRAGRFHLHTRADGDVTVRDGKPSGSLRLSDGRARWASEQLDGLAVDAVFAGDQLIVRKAAAVYRRGRLDAHGHITLAGLEPRALDLALRTRELPLSRATLGLWLDSEATLHLVRQPAGLAGTLVVQRADAHVVRAGAGRTLQPVGPLADVTVVDRRAAAAGAAALTPLTLPRLGLPLHLAVEVPGPVHIAGQEIDVHARGSLVVDTGGAHATVRGRTEALPGGRLTLFDRRYDIERAALAFDGHDVDVDLAVTREVGDVALTLELSGPLEAPRVRLVSDPPVYDERQIGGLVASGDARAEGVSSGQIGGQMVGVITGLIAGRVRDKMASLPLDVVKVEPGATAATPSRLEIGKFILGDRLYVSYAYQFGGLTLPTRRLNAHQAQIQLKLVRRLSLDARYGDAGAGALDLTFTLRR